MIKQFRDTHYFISDDGKVYSNYKNDMKELKPFKNHKGYLLVDIHQKTFSVHRLVAECFLENWNEKLQVNHKDLDKKNNNVDNLEMVTNKENQHHYFKSKFGEEWKPMDEKELKNYHKTEKQKEYRKKYRLEHKEKQKEYMKTYVKRNK
jgi:hypothetical protein